MGRLLAAAAAAAAGVLAASLAGCAAGAPPATGRSAALAAVPDSYLGVYENGVPASYGPIASFASAVGRWPRIVVYYSAWSERFWPGFGQAATAHRAILTVQLQPSGIPLAAIADGRYDRYLRSYAAAVRAFGRPVILSFAHEMNAGWYSWGAGHEAPSVFIAAWRHLVEVFRTAGASNATWLWTINSINAASPPWPWWPGAAWVNWVGVDGYYYRASDTYASVFGSTIAAVRRFTVAPVLISEVAAGPNAAQVAQINGLFAGIRSSRVLGLVWFDVTQQAGIYHQDWRLENSPAALAAFRGDAADLYR